MRDRCSTCAACGSVSPIEVRRPAEAEHRAVYRDPYAYASHPHAVVQADGSWVAVFNLAPRRVFVLHPPQDPLFRNVLVRSTDEGVTWSGPVVAPDYRWSGVECAGLTALRSGRLLLHQWRFRWEPLHPGGRPEPGALGPMDFAEHLHRSTNIDTPPDILARAEMLFPWTRANDGAWVHVSDDGGRAWHHTAKVPGGGYGMRGAVEFPDGRLLLPFCDMPGYRFIGVSESMDGGLTWSAVRTIAGNEAIAFAEPAPLLTSEGALLMLLRDDATGDLHRIASDDGGATWSAPERTSLPGFPAHLTELADGRILCTYGVRRPPYAIEAVLSDDGGGTFDPARRIAIRSDLGDKDLGYPVTLQRTDGKLVSLYYCRNADGVTGIEETIWSL
jgi:hypothetical protein